jgi:hypothetical protein
VTIVQSAIIILFPNVFVAPIFRHAASAEILGWILAALTVAIYTVYSVRGLRLMPYLTNLSPVKLLGPIIAIPTSILEEIFFRKFLMDTVAGWGQGALLQVLASALIFGIAHAFWALRGGREAFVGAVGSTTLLGAMLGIVYIASNRVVLPCIAAHFALNCILEPWLVYAYALRAMRRAAAVTT